MTEITIPDMHIKEIEQLIQDDAIKREFGYGSVDDFILRAIKGGIEASKDEVGIPIH